MRGRANHSVFGNTIHRTLLSIAVPIAVFLAAAPYGRAAENHRTLVAQTRPVYPEIARQMHIYGSLLLEITIAPDGRVSAIKPRSGHPLLLRAADEAVRRWIYSPAQEASTITVQIDFLPNQ